MRTSNRSEIIDEIKSRCNIVDVIGSVVTLKKAGANYQGLCPFHNEKTPSFVVSESKQMFTCFGCHASGDVIEFVKRYYNLSFMEALEKLAAQCGITIEDNFHSREKRDIYYEINREAARFFFKALRTGDNPGVRYVLKRGLKKETLHDFGIGYADESWDSLYKHLKSKGYDEKTMLKLGLISTSKGKYFDKFRNRVIFPIQNTAGKVIAFGGRAIGDEMPKYLNSQETPIFSKKNNLYGLNITKNYVNEMHSAILVEGYMDVVSLYQGGVKNVAASLGTALTENQAKLLKRYSKNVILSYDADSAGINAAVRGSEILYNENVNVRILHIPDGKDPDDYIKKHGKDKYYELVEGALSYGDFIIQNMAKSYDIDTVEGRVGFLRAIANFLSKLRPVESDILIKKVAKDYSVSEGALRTEMGIDKEKEEKREFEKKRIEEVDKDNLQIGKREQSVIKVLITESKYFGKVKENEGLFKSQIGLNIFKEIEKLHDKNEDINYEELYDNLEPDEAEALDYIDKNISIGGNPAGVFKDCMKSYMKERLEDEEHDLLMQLSIADEEQNSQEITRLTEALMEIQKKKSLGGNK